jgi:hypothetical protein
MTRPHTNCVLDQYELAVEEAVAACNGDVRAALRTLLTLNQLLELELERMSALLIGHQVNESDLPRPSLQ